MKQIEIKPCAECGKGVIRTGLPIFWRVTIERMAVDVNAVRRQAVLEMMMCDPYVAYIMGPQDDLAKPIFDADVVLLCEACAITKQLNIMALAEAETERKKSRENKAK